ncbi:NUDIX hydrolase [Microbacterium sp. NPDC006705]|uniref:NUDIX hydrolase n=1 Tax=Microbacterium TaxID=33882 RepID=UPI002B49A719|nr:NUDIX domain-containing protein [Microbacterium plantarum]WRK17636.1 NUDIX domain-containing protein [Microbacterium plantarum]
MTIIDRTASYAKQFTVSGYVLNPAEDRILLIHHKKLAKWLPPGGHVDEDETPQAAVVREVFEETGVAAVLRRTRASTSPRTVAPKLSSTSRSA